ncbi:hypothetical protein MRX96_013360 [Rhipicephalus microplus]
MTAAPTGGYASPPHPIAHEASHRLLGATAAEQKGTDPRNAASARRHASSVNNEVISLEPVAAVRVGLGVVPPERQVHALSREEDTGTDGMFALEAADSHIGHVGITQPIVRTLDCGGVPVNMQVDTGSPVSAITWPTYERNKTVWPKLRGSPLKLTCFLGRLPVRGQLQLKVSCGNKSTAGSLQVLGCSGPNLCGRDLIQAFHMLEAPVMNVNTSETQEETVDGEYVLLTETLNDGVMSAKQLGTLTELDDDLAKEEHRGERQQGARSPGAPQLPVLRRSGRQRKPPDRYSP